MLFDVLPDGTLRLVSEEDEDIEREFQLMDNVRDMLAALAWTEVFILLIHCSFVAF